MSVKMLCGIVATCVAALTGGAASAQRLATTETLVAQCAAETRASGSFAVVVQAPVPQVAAAAGATQRGARDVNDCLEDKYQTQPGFDGVTFGGETVVATGRPITRSQCERLFTRGRGEAFARGFGASLLGGAIGAGIHSATLTENFQRCVAGGRIVLAGGYGNRGCGYGRTILVGGSGYCLRN